VREHAEEFVGGLIFGQRCLRFSTVSWLPECQVLQEHYAMRTKATGQ
jgi:hypothetical protein